jgi:hypothetical protein
MKALLDRRPSAAVVISIVALVMATVGTGYAALKLPKNAVGTKQLKKNSVTTAKIKKNAVTGAKVKKRTLTGSDINLNKLGTVPSAETANTVPPREGIHFVGAPNEPGFEAGSGNFGPAGPFNLAPVGFFKDHDDVVHLAGVAKTTTGIIFRLPTGFRPASGQVEYFVVGENPLIVFGSNFVIEGQDLSGAVLATEEAALLSGFSFRAQS